MSETAANRKLIDLLLRWFLNVEQNSCVRFDILEKMQAPPDVPLAHLVMDARLELTEPEHGERAPRLRALLHRFLSCDRTFTEKSIESSLCDCDDPRCLVALVYDTRRCLESN